MLEGNDNNRPVSVVESRAESSVRTGLLRALRPKMPSFPLDFRFNTQTTVHFPSLRFRGCRIVRWMSVVITRYASMVCCVALEGCALSWAACAALATVNFGLTTMWASTLGSLALLECAFLTVLVA